MREFYGFLFVRCEVDRLDVVEVPFTHIVPRHAGLELLVDVLIEAFFCGAEKVKRFAVFVLLSGIEGSAYGCAIGVYHSI